MSKYQALKGALAYAKQTGGIGLTASVSDLDALLADLEMAEKVMTSPSAGIDQPPAYTYTSTQSTMCASCGEHKHTPLRIDAMGGYVCLTCIDQKLGALLGEFGSATPPAPQPAPVDERAEFEAWARPNGYDMPRNDVLGHYSSLDTLRAWTGWQARAALQSPAPKTKGGGA